MYGFVQPETGATEWLLLPTVNVAVFDLALAHFARAVGAGSAKQIVLVLNQAGWHQNPQVLVPQSLHLVPLPPYSPELQPAERLWPLTNEPLANRTFATLSELDAVLRDRCADLVGPPRIGPRVHALSLVAAPRRII